MKNTIERKSWSGKIRTLIKIKPLIGWRITLNPYNTELPVLSLSPLAAKRVVAELQECLEFYNSDYHLWSQRKIDKPCK